MKKHFKTESSYATVFFIDEETMMRDNVCGTIAIATFEQFSFSTTRKRFPTFDSKQKMMFLAAFHFISTLFTMVCFHQIFDGFSDAMM